MKNILVVCTGNLFRSPITAGFLRQILVLDGLQSQISILSAGLDAVPGSQIPDDVIKLLANKYGLDLAAHRAQRLSPILFHQADLVLAMEQPQIMRLAQQYPRQSRKLRLVSELTGAVYDIADPAARSELAIVPLADQLRGLVQPNFVTLLSWLELANQQK